MAVEEIGRLRTIAIVGQGGTGKTQPADAMLFTAGATPRLGQPDDGSAAMDFEPEETKHHISISSAFNHLNWKKTEVIFADTPGYTAFLPETLTTLRAVDGVVMLISPGADIKVESEKIWAATEDLKLPRIAFVSRLDRERTNFDAAMNDLEKVLGARAVALTIPIGEELGFKGVIDVLAMKALTYADTSGKFKEEELSADLKTQAEAARTTLFEAVAETDDALLEKYLDKGNLDDAEVRAALHAAVVERKITPVLCGSGAKNIGLAPLLDAVTTYLPAPNERPASGMPESHDRRAGQPSRRSGRAVLRAGLQDDHRSVRGQALDLPYDFGPRPDRCRPYSTRRAKPRSASASCCASRARSSRRLPARSPAKSSPSPSSRTPPPATRYATRRRRCS